jgi:hypothetical protein
MPFCAIRPREFECFTWNAANNFAASIRRAPDSSISIQSFAVRGKIWREFYRPMKKDDEEDWVDHPTKGDIP